MSKMETTTQDGVTLVDAKMLANMLSVSPRTIWRLRSAGKLPKPVAFGGSVRWRVSDVEAWLSLGCPDQTRFTRLMEVE